MHVDDAKCNFVCEPIYDLTGNLKAVEMLTRFTTMKGDPKSYAEMQLKMLKNDEWEIFKLQLEECFFWEDYLTKNNILISININTYIAEKLLACPLYHGILNSNIIKLEISESFRHSQLNDETSILLILSKLCGLWLDDVGSGNFNNFNHLISGRFQAAKVDKNYFWRMYNCDRKNFDKAIRDLWRYSGRVVIEGVETSEHLTAIMPYTSCWVQGFLFPSVQVEHLKTIPLRIETINNYLEIR